MSTINVTLKDLAKQYPVYTKKGTPWPKRIDWTHIEIEGNIIVTRFGTFTFLKAQRINKMWYWVLKDEEGKVFKITRRQARENKRMPKNRQALSIEQPQDIVIPNVLCLPEPKEYIDRLIDELNYFMREDYLKRPEVIADIELFSKKFKGHHPWPLIPQGLDDKSKIYNVLRVSNLRDDVSTIYKKLLKYYHPDHCTKDNAAELTEYLVTVYKMKFKNQQGSQSKNTPPKAKPKAKDKPKSSKKGVNKVAMYKDGELVQVFNSVAECKEHFNLCKSNTIINQCCNGRAKSYKGYTFKYVTN